MYKHIYDIKTVIPYSNKATSVSNHFNLKHHNFNFNFSFFVLRKDLMELEARLDSESFLLNWCKLMGVNLINDHIPLVKDFYKVHN